MLLHCRLQGFSALKQVNFEASAFFNVSFSDALGTMAMEQKIEEINPHSRLNFFSGKARSSSGLINFMRIFIFFSEIVADMYVAIEISKTEILSICVTQLWEWSSYCISPRFRPEPKKVFPPDLERGPPHPLPLQDKIPLGLLPPTFSHQQSNICTFCISIKRWTSLLQLKSKLLNDSLWSRFIFSVTWVDLYRGQVHCCIFAVIWPRISHLVN